MKKIRNKFISLMLVCFILLVQMPVDVLASNIKYNITPISYTMIVGECKTFQLSASVSPGSINGSLGYNFQLSDGEGIPSDIVGAISHSNPAKGKVDVTAVALKEGYVRLRPAYNASVPGDPKNVTFSETHYLIRVISPEFVVSFDVNGGSCSIGAHRVHWNEPYSYYGSLPTPVREGYHFDGWYTDEGAEVTNTTIFQSKSSVILHARWSPLKYYVYFEPVGGETPLDYKQVTYGEKYGELPIPTREGYTFRNWSTQREYGIAVTSDTIMKEADDQMLYAVWTRNPDTTDNGHLLVKTDAQQPSCTQSGYEAYWSCSTCGKMFRDEQALREITKPVKVDASGHNYESRIVPPSCLEDGYTVITCKDCGDSSIEDRVNAFGHTPKILAGVEATCQKEGLTKGSQCEVCGEILVRQEAVEKTPHNYETVTVKATTARNGSIVQKCEACGSRTGNSVIYKPGSVRLKQFSYVYAGDKKKPAVTVTDSRGTIISADNYAVSYSKNQSVGNAAVKITFKGNYSGTITKTFKINPKGTQLLQLKPKAKGFTVKWKKQKTQISGYEVQYSTSKTFKKNSKVKRIRKTASVHCTISKLAPKKRYYVRIRTFKTIGAGNYYSSWSAAKKVTTSR